MDVNSSKHNSGKSLILKHTPLHKPSFFKESKTRENSI